MPSTAQFISFWRGLILTSSPTTQADASLSTDAYAASVAAATGGDVFIPVQATTPPAIIAQAPVTHAIGICSVIDTSAQSKMPDFSPFPTTQAQIYFSHLDIEKAQIQVISSPQHGALVPGLHRDNMPYPSSDWDGAAYHPDAGYTGYDKFSMRVSDGKYSIVIYYNLQIFDGLPYANAANQDPWCIGQNFKISSIATGLGSIAQEDLTGAQIRYANLPGMALGQEESGTHSVVITLDETASGYGWFIDAMPADSTA